MFHFYVTKTLKPLPIYSNTQKILEIKIQTIKKKSETYQFTFKMRNSTVNVCDLPAKCSVSSPMLLSQVRQGIFECAGGNSAGPKRCWCQSLHEYKAEAPTQFWKQTLRGICPCKCFWGSLMSQISICAGSALCHFIPSVFDHQHTRQGCFFALRNIVQSCLTYSKRQWQNQSPSWHAVYWHYCLYIDINPKRMANQQVSCPNKNDSEQPFYPHRNFCEQNQIWNWQTFLEKQACFSVDNTDLVLTYNVY